MDATWTCHLNARGPVGAPPLLFLHGFLGRATDWDALRRDLAADYRCLTLDLPGHGASPWPPAPARLTLARVADAVAAALRAQGAAPVTVVGYSLGGRLALALAARHPRCVSRLVLVSSSPGVEERTVRAARRTQDAAWAARFAQEPLAAVLRAWYAQPLFASLGRAPARRAALLATRAHNSPTALAAAITAFSPGREPARWTALSRLVAAGLPVLALAGEHDARYVVLAQAMAARAPGLRVDIVPGAGHTIPREQPDALAARLRAWLRQPAPG